MTIRGLFRPLVALALAAGMAGSAAAATEADVNARIDAVLGKHSRYEETIKLFQQAVVAGDKADVAAFVRYPIVVTIDGRKRTIDSSAEFIRNYDAIMTAGIVDAVKNQKYEDLLVNDEGVMFGNGEVWISGICLSRHCKQWVPKVITLQHSGL